MKRVYRDTTKKMQAIVQQSVAQQALIPILRDLPLWFSRPSLPNFTGLYAQSRKVGEPAAVVCVEFEAYPEPKALLPAELSELVVLHGTTQKVAYHIGASEAFVRQNMSPRPSSLRVP